MEIYLLRFQLQIQAYASLHTPRCITCSKCSFKSKENKQSQEKFECQSCGYKNNADLNAALNVLAAGHAVLACEWKRISGRKQELLGKSDQVLACAVA